MKKYLSVNDISELLNKSESACIACDNNCIEIDGFNLKRNAKCPHCGESYYMEKYSMTTAAYYPPIYKNVVNINPDRNTTTTYCECMNCKKEFYYNS